MKNKKILIQVGKLITFVFFLGILFISTIFILTNTHTYLKEKQKTISADLNAVSYAIDIQSWKDEFTYIEHHMDEIKDVDRSKDDVFDSTDFKDFQNLSDDDKTYICAFLYFYYSEVFEREIKENAFDYSHAFLMDISEKNRGFVFYNIEGNKLDENTLGRKWDYDLDEHPAAKKIIEGEDVAFENWKDPTDNVNYYVGYVALDDEHEWVLCLSYDWSYMRSRIFNNTLILVAVLIVTSLLFQCFVILFFLRNKVLLPLTDVETGLRDYMENKASDEVVRKMSEVESENEIGVLANDISQLAIEIDDYMNENIKLASEKQRVQSELNFASQIQDSALIKDFDINDKIEVWASMNPAKEVGGDLYDVFMIDDDHIGMCIADVSGKGVPASLVMMSATTAIRSFALSGIGCSEILEKLNNVIKKRELSNMFITVWIGILDLKTGILTTANGGHEYPAIYHGDQFVLFKDRHGLVVGGYLGTKYPEETLQLKPGDMIYVYTDGVAEAQNPSDEFYGCDRIIDSLNRVMNENRESGPKEIIEGVTEDLDKFVQDAEQFDDTTMLCVKYLG
ncbi:MAG: serine/threonine-protein phosphatase [Eubacterium sp.]|nr:serine/threonine-protein phosphatase [Eubacterium sp.]